jgi:hypothetical protein
MADHLDGAVRPAALDAADYNASALAEFATAIGSGVAAPVASARHPH